MKEEFEDFYISIKEGRLRFSQKAYIFLFCLLLSIFFWFLSALSKQYTTELSIPLSYSSLSEQFVLDEEPLQEVKIRVRSSGFELLGEQFSLNRKEVYLDLKEARSSGKKQFFYLARDLRTSVLDVLDRDIELLEIRPDSIVLPTQKRLEKTLTVKLKSNISYANGYGKRGEVKLNPSEVKVSGPKQLIDSLSQIQTEDFIRKEVKDTLIERLKLKIPQSLEGIYLEPAEVELRLAVEKFTEKSLSLVVGLDQTTDAIDLQCFPNEVKAFFLVPLSAYQEFNASQLRAFVKLEEAQSSNKKLNVYLEGTPSYAKLLRIEPERLEYIIKK